MSAKQIAKTLSEHQISADLICECGHEYFPEDAKYDGDQWQAAYTGHQADMIAAALSAPDCIPCIEWEGEASEFRGMYKEMRTQRGEADEDIRRVRDLLAKEPTTDPLSGFYGPPDDMPSEGDFADWGRWSLAQELREALDGDNK